MISSAAYILLAMLITLPIATVKFYSKKNLPGIILCFVIAVIAWFLGQSIPLAGGAVIGISIGMILANFRKYQNTFKPGIKETSKRMLQSAVVLLGFQMNFRDVSELGGQSIILIAVSISAALLASFAVGRVIGVTFNEKTLIGIGTAICGGSAIAAASPAIKASDRETASAISTIFLFNVIAVFVWEFNEYERSSLWHVGRIGYQRYIVGRDRRIFLQRYSRRCRYSC